MTEKELHRLRRENLLELLLAQGKEAAAMQASFMEKERELEKLQEGYERLKEKLDEKDAQIEKLKDRLNQKDEKIHELRMEMEVWRSNRRIEVKKAGSIAEASLKLNDVFETAQRAADQYLYNIRQMQMEQEQMMRNHKKAAENQEEQ